jgi:hypothetical protein
MTHLPHARRSVSQLSAVDNWALAIATALVALIVLGVLPHLSW